ncbi:Chitinase domain-containing protein 1 [Cytospora mali]|uniref:Chitinase domain-containing protein 1 n=1 Tax=Cytospora mali TaxID=578113 RepID=A0A194W363_CYTMA|nr:Chitinase domain-containing protein 1 [Valsa mali]
MATPTRQGQLELLLTYLLITLFAIKVQCQPDESAQHPIGQEHSPRHYPNLPVLGYVTPWNSRGKGLVEEYRQKFDIVSPVWYTVHANEAHGEDLYTVRGGPPSEEDEAWYRRLQQPLGTEGPSKPLQITPRFFLDGWKPEDYQGLVLNQTRWQMLSDAVMGVVTKMSYDGIVFESGASYALGPPLTAVSGALHAEGKILILVMPPIRKPIDEMTASHNALITDPVAGLSHYIDYFSIMTYDMSGPGGQEIHNATGLPENSSVRKAIAQGQVRQPGPNTSGDWVRENLVIYVEASHADTMDQLQYPSRFKQESLWASRKFLMGMPLYGYKYPVLFIDRKTGNVAQQIPQDTGSDAPLPILTGAGEPVTTVEILNSLKKADSRILKTDEGEYFFDVEKAPGEGHWRVYLPTSEGISHVLDTIQDVVDDELMYTFGGAGVALWEVGQSSGELLAAL